MLEAVFTRHTERPSLSQDEALKRYPRLICHLICESLGYFTPRSAANAIILHRAGKPFFCEWYSHLAQFRPGSSGLFDEDAVLQVGRDALRDAFARRRQHRGYMADYRAARAVMAAELQGKGPQFASWF